MELMEQFKLFLNLCVMDVPILHSSFNLSLLSKYLSNLFILQI